MEQNKLKIPKGADAIGASVARDFGKHGIFVGEVTEAHQMRGKWIYHVKYTDGDAEDFDAGQLEYAYCLALDQCGRKEHSFQDERRSSGASLNGTSNVGLKWRNLSIGKQMRCTLCKYRAAKARSQNKKPPEVKKTRKMCSVCTDIPLCKSCFPLYHSTITEAFEI